ncbi:MAG: hypothetical protein ACK4V7_03545 [Chitinophagaceae bacterium]|jgi:hypothetical protein|nr:hypothetical protein [Sediminibacterium sp.]
MLRKYVTILLMSLYLLGATEAYQLLKMPYLIEHYKTHKQYNNDLSFSTFIHIHYFTNQTYDSDYQQDMQLPFKSSNRTISLLNFVSLFVPKQTIQPLVLNRISKNYVLFNDKKHLSNPLENIFQPPKA